MDGLLPYPPYLFLFDYERIDSCTADKRKPRPLIRQRSISCYSHARSSLRQDKHQAVRRAGSVHATLVPITFKAEMGPSSGIPTDLVYRQAVEYNLSQLLLRLIFARAIIPIRIMPLPSKKIRMLYFQSLMSPIRQPWQIKAGFRFTRTNVGGSSSRTEKAPSLEETPSER